MQQIVFLCALRYFPSGTATDDTLSLPPTAPLVKPKHPVWGTLTLRASFVFSSFVTQTTRHYIMLSWRDITQSPLVCSCFFFFSMSGGLVDTVLELYLRWSIKVLSIHPNYYPNPELSLITMWATERHSGFIRWTNTDTEWTQRGFETVFVL